MKSLLDRLADKVLIGDGCWGWTGARDLHGYGRMRDGRATTFAHKAVYGLMVGPVPDGLELDHLCRNPACVRPDHLEPVTHAENVRRGRGGWHTRARTECPQGHPYDEVNTRWYQGRRYCRACHKARATISGGRPPRRKAA